MFTDVTTGQSCCSFQLQNLTGSAGLTVVSQGFISRLLFCFFRPAAQKAALIVFAHQSQASFNAAARDVAVQELRAQGFRVTVSDLYAMKFRAEASRDDIMGDSQRCVCRRNNRNSNVSVLIESLQIHFQKKIGMSKKIVKKSRKQLKSKCWKIII